MILGVFGEDAVATTAVGVDGDGLAVEPTDAWEGASLANMIVATAVLQLVDQGLVDLDAPVSAYVDFPVPDSVTVRHVLGHRSGMPDMRTQLTACPSESTLEVMKDVAGQTAGPQPGSTADYANTNYLLLGYLVGRVTGVDVGAFAKANIFEPLGMASTYWWESQDGPPPYSRRPGSDPARVNASNCRRLETTVGTEGHTFVTTLGDLDAFLRGLFGGDLVSEASLAAMLPSPENEAGYGLWAHTAGDRDENTLVGHFGSRDDIEAFAYFDPAKDRSIIVFGAGTDGVEDLVWAAWDWAEANAAG